LAESYAAFLISHTTTDPFSFLFTAFVGHGIGRALHEDPQVPNFGSRGKGTILKNGMVIAIEPMVNIGSPEVEVLSDGWTVVTRDGKFSAHYEHTIAITSNGPEILTKV
jgi:methionyl aminopeptidase